MSGSKTDGIELHFCRDCGISIPISDIEAGQANPALPGCAYARDNCSNRSSAPVPDAPAPVTGGVRTATRAAPARVDSAREGGLRIVAAIALLYVVGASTFLLFRDLSRPPAKVILPTDIAMHRDLRDLERKIDAVDKGTRETLAQIRSGDTLQASTLASLRTRLKELSAALASANDASETRDKELNRGLLALTEETLGLKTPIADILTRLDDGAVVLGGDPAGNSGKKDPGATNKDPATKPQTGAPPVDPKVRKQVDAFIKQLTDRSASDQTRYNAAVQLGDLGHPSAVEPLLAALRKDPYDLVRRAAAFSLGMLGKHSIVAIPTLIEGVAKQEEYVGYMCARALSEISKATLGRAEEFGYDPTMTARQRKSVMAKWQAWWDKNRTLIQPSASR